MENKNPENRENPENPENLENPVSDNRENPSVSDPSKRSAYSLNESVVSINPVPPRGSWARKSEFILSCMGYAIGISNVWRFPYLCYRSGGGAFLVPYLLMLFICGIPLFFLETSLGQFASTGCITIFEICPIFRGAGIAMVLVNLIVTMYYNVLQSYSLVFCAFSFRSKLPWSDCSNEWNTQNCSNLRDTIPHGIKVATPADEFFHKRLLQISPGIEYPGNIVWEILVGNLVTWIVVYLCIMNGVKSVGKVVYVSALFPYVMLFILFIRGVTLPGAAKGILYYISPTWSELTRIKTWVDAAVQIFFSMGPGWGGLINMASYNPFHNSTRNDSILVPIINGATSIFAGFVVFSVIGYMSHETGLPIEEVATSGPGLAFVTYPEAIAMMPIPQLWSVLFFLMLFSLGLDSVFVQIESIVSSVEDQYVFLRPYKKQLTFAWCLLMFIGSLGCCTNGGIYVLSLLDWYCAAVTIISTCFVEILIIGWIYGIKKFMRDLEFMVGHKLSRIWTICWKYIMPVNLIIIFASTIIFNQRIVYNDVHYPTWAVAVGWMTCVISAINIPAYMIYKLLITPGSLKERLKICTTATKKWGPAKLEDKREWRRLIRRERNYKPDEPAA